MRHNARVRRLTYFNTKGAKLPPLLYSWDALALSISRICVRVCTYSLEIIPAPRPISRTSTLFRGSDPARTYIIRPGGISFTAYLAKSLL